MHCVYHFCIKKSGIDTHSWVTQVQGSGFPSTLVPVGAGKDEKDLCLGGALVSQVEAMMTELNLPHPPHAAKGRKTKEMRANEKMTEPFYCPAQNSPVGHHQINVSSIPTCKTSDFPP